MIFRSYLLPLLAICTFATASLFGAKTNLENPYSLEYVIAQDTIPLEDRQGDFLNSPSTNPFDLNDPSSVEQNVEYDPETNSYIITETIGDGFFRSPTFMTFDEYLDYREEQDQRRYFDILQGKDVGGDDSNGLKDPISDIDVQNSMLDRLFGGTEVDIRPQGNIDLTFGVDFQNVQNPALTLRQQRQGGFDFDMAIQMNVEGQIGEKLKLSTNYNTQATFDFDNQLKLDYDTDAFSEDEIIKNIEAGNVSLPLRSQLITGAQSLFGLKTELQFGRLRVTALASQQKSEQESITIQGGAQEQFFEVRADDYDENRHFFLSHYNRNSFEPALENLPQIRSLFRLERIEVYLTNDRNDSENIREIVALADLGEGDVDRITNDNPVLAPPAVPVIPDITGQALPGNNANPLFNLLTSNPDNAQLDRITGVLTRGPYNLTQGQDFDRVSARILSDNEFTVNEQLGFVSLNVNVQPDQVVAVSYLYTYNGKTYQVGQFSEVSPTGDDVTEQKVLYTRMLKPITQQVRPSPNSTETLPTWDLMMKNVYPTGAYQADPNEFFLDIYYENPEGTPQPYLPETQLANKRLLNVFNLDDLNQLGDPQPDGVFDYVPGVTINPRSGRIIFPKLEPFGSDLAEQIDNQAFEAKYTFPQLYTETKTDAREEAQLNRFIIRGQYKSSVSSEISLGSFNIPEGSERVTAGGRVLQRNVDYEIDYSIGRIRILNDAILSSGANINVSFEDNSLFGFQQKTMLGLRADYTFSKNFSIGATYLHLFERPYTPKVNAGDDPLNNRIVGLDLNFSQDAPWLTKLADKLPFYSTKEKSTFSFQAEAAAIKPGHSKAINEGLKKDDPENGLVANPDRDGGVVYVDDFEGATSQLDLRQAPNRWALSSVPQHHPEFPEADLINQAEYGMNRAKMSWYRIQDGGVTDNPYTSTVSLTEIFPNFTNPNTGGFANANANRAFTLNLNYFPSEPGPYNYDPPAGSQYSDGVAVTNNGIILQNASSRWAGITSALQNNDFQAANYEFVEMWVLSPYLREDGMPGPGANADGNDGEILLHFGNISEDILRDSRKFYENGLPAENLDPQAPFVETQWGRVPVQQQITATFDADPATRDEQDLGLDGLTDAGERATYENYVTAIESAPSANGFTLNDPSHDNFLSFRAEANEGLDVITRYANQNNPQGNSESATSGVSTAGNQQPDSEDLNRDFTMNEAESYFEYRIPIQHDGNGGIDIFNNPYFTGDVREDDATNRIWYRIKVPLDQRGTEANNPFFNVRNGIQNFRSIRFVRMIVKDFTQPTFLRVARMDLVRNQWRRLINGGIDDTSVQVGDNDNDNTVFDVNEVNIEENDDKRPFGYTLPPGIQREQAIGGLNFNALQNERSLALEVCDLDDGEREAIYKNSLFDMRFYEGLKMFVHAESVKEELEDGDLRLFVRLGSDFRNNYYEYEMPLVISTADTVDYNDPDYPRVVWPLENDMEIDFQEFKNLKLERNAAGASFATNYPADNVIQPFSEKGDFYRLRGNPNLGDVKSVMIGIYNPQDDGVPHCAEIWVNEMRLFGLDDSGGIAALARADFQIADLGNAAASFQISSQGWGELGQTLLERSREEIIKADWSFNVELGKFLPEKSGVKIPFYFQDSREIKTPQFDPFDRDIELDTKLNEFEGSDQDSVRNQALDYTRVRSMNFTNVRKERTGTDKKEMPWDVANFSLSYGVTETEHRDPIVENSNIKNYRGSVDYNYSTRNKPIKPFKKLSKSKWLKLITEFNFNPLPANIGFSSIMDREIGETKFRFAGNDPEFNTFYQKRWTWDRNYVLNWNFAKNIKFNFNATSTSVIDEAPIDIIKSGEIVAPYRGQIDTDIEKELVWDNIRNLGRDKEYNHNFGLNYTLPTKLIPILDWVNVKASYTATYSWLANSLALQDSLGNVIRNTQVRQVNADLDFTKLYKKSKYLKQIEGQQRGKQRQSPRSRSRQEGDAKKKDGKKDDKSKKQREPSKVERMVIRPLLLLRKVRASYSENFGTILPGFMQNDPENLGLSNNFTQPGWKFIGGWQPNLDPENYYGPDDFLYNNYQWFSPSVWQQNQVQQNYSRQWDGRVSIEPFKNFKLDLEMNSQYTEFHTELFKRDTVFPGTIDPAFNATQAEYNHLAPKDRGSYNISFYGLNTLFGFGDSNRQEELFNEFLDNRGIIADRLGGTASNHQDSLFAAQGYPNGYGPTNQEVFVPAFLAAYSGKDASTSRLNILNAIPKLNWRLNYSGLSKLPAFKEIFHSFKLSHAYRSSLTVNSFVTDLRYDFEDPKQINQDNLNFFSRFQIPEVVLTDQFSPLIGIDMRLKNEMSLRVDYKISRSLALSGQGYTLQTTSSEEFVVGFGYKLKDVDIPFLTGSKKKKNKKKKEEEAKKEEKNGQGNRVRGLGNSGSADPGDLDLNFDFSFRDDITNIRNFDAETRDQPTRGSTSLRISPSAEYRLNKQLSLRLFFDYNSNKPRTTQGFPITNTQGGIMVRFTLQ